MLVLAPDQQVKEYPYTIGALMRDNPNVSFPANISDEELVAWDVYRVVEQSPPEFNPATEDLVRVNPVYDNGSWRESWIVKEASKAEQQRRTEAKGVEVRDDRNARLAECDWTQLPDAPVDHAVWAAYRQELRDVTEQSGFPWDVQWPTQPSSN